MTLIAAGAPVVAQPAGLSVAQGAIIAAAISGSIALVGVILAYRAGRRQVAEQELVAHRAWRRQNRLEAYRDLLVAVDRLHGTLAPYWQRPVTVEDAWPDAVRLQVAHAAIELAGPPELKEPAETLLDAAVGAFAEVVARKEKAEVAPAHWDALDKAKSAFVARAAAVLDDPGA